MLEYTILLHTAKQENFVRPYFKVCLCTINGSIWNDQTDAHRPSRLFVRVCSTKTFCCISVELTEVRRLLVKKALRLHCQEVANLRPQGPAAGIRWRHVHRRQTSQNTGKECTRKLFFCNFWSLQSATSSCCTDTCRGSNLHSPGSVDKILLTWRTCTRSALSLVETCTHAECPGLNRVVSSD